MHTHTNFIHTYVLCVCVCVKINDFEVVGQTIAKNPGLQQSTDTSNLGIVTR